MTTQPPAALVGYPADGQVDVPTDVVPFYDLNTARIADATTAEFLLTSSEDDAISVQTELSQQWYVDLLPARPLQPNTTYRIDLALPNEANVTGVSFTTGAGPFEGVPEAPTASLQHYQFAPGVPQSSCSPLPTGTCIALGGSLPVEMTSIANGHVDQTYVYLLQRSFFTNLSGLDQGTPFDCVSLRSRAPNRVYSAPVQLCRDDGPLLTLTSDQITCTPEGLMQAPARPGTPSGNEDPPSGNEDPPSGAGGGSNNPEAAPAADAMDEGAQGSDESVSCGFSAADSDGASHTVLLLLGAAALPLLRRRQAAARMRERQP